MWRGRDQPLQRSTDGLAILDFDEEEGGEVLVPVRWEDLVDELMERAKVLGGTGQEEGAEEDSGEGLGGHW